MEVTLKILGLITEYNPFHNGHLYHLNKSKEQTGATHTVVVMSGNFVQRGEPAIFDKWTRAEMAVRNGADLVIELPTIFAVNSAEYFAYGAVKLLDSLGVVDTLCFGSEEGNIEPLENIADVLIKEPPAYRDLLKMHLEEGVTFPAARAKALTEYFNNQDAITSIVERSNNILGIEYIKALKLINSTIKADTILRIKSDYNSISIIDNITSATGIRHLLECETDDIDTLEIDAELNFDQGFDQAFDAVKHLVPEGTFEVLSRLDISDCIFPQDTFNFLIYKLRTLEKQSLSEVHDVTEGLENRILKFSNSALSYDELIDAVKSKRYTQTRINRIMMNTLLDIHKRDVGTINESLIPEYGRVLAFNERGREVLKKIKKEAEFDMITNINKFQCRTEAQEKMLALDILASDIYALLTPNIRGGKDYLTQPFMLK